MCFLILSRRLRFEVLHPTILKEMQTNLASICCQGPDTLQTKQIQDSFFPSCHHTPAHPVLGGVGGGAMGVGAGGDSKGGSAHDGRGSGGGKGGNG